MEVTTFWQETARGPALCIELAGRRVSFLELDLKDAPYVAAVSLWEGIGGVMPRGFVGRWHWRRDFKRVLRGISQAVAERGAYSEPVPTIG